MSMRISVIINPEAGSGAGGRALPTLKTALPEICPGADLSYLPTKSKAHAVELGATVDSDLIVVVSGDGTIHDVAQGLMRRPQMERPRLAMLPVGSGNDIGRTFGMPGDLKHALATLGASVLAERFRPFDVGKVSQGDNQYFLETLSFGVDAAVALNTVTTRQKNAARGLRLYALTAAQTVLHELRPHHFRLVLDGKAVEGDLLICAIQNGPTYGSGFRVTPTADPGDGWLDLCTVNRVSHLHAFYLLSRMKNGNHLSLCPPFSFYRARSIDLSVDEPGDEQIPIQCDGERLLGSSFHIEVVPGALTVLFGM
ncbi:MAG: diacylglycerol kinase family lipid kinase [Coriobacteriales bacterium]|jgi:YegS/Rv2252/BmrU family lipid kinase|nr:diacylglycerol kinase family lipid kinase [Coriobacteriales bacterium]